MTPDLSVIIPVYNRGDVVRYTFESVKRAGAGLTVETIVVDDGSTEPFAPLLARLGYTADRIIRQSNQGLLFARLAGLAAARGRYIQFLDSDDLVAPEKWRTQITAQEAADAAVSYTGVARAILGGDYDALKLRFDALPASVDNVVDCFLGVQPAPHSPLFRRDYLAAVVAQPLFPPSPRFNCVAEIWFYHNAAVRPARVVPVPASLAIVGEHPGVRLTSHWERLGLASLQVMEDFMRACPIAEATLAARQAVGQAAFNAWRRLPKDFDPRFDAQMLALWRQAPRGPLSRLGERRFALLARLLGPEFAGRMLRRLRGHTYASCRTLNDEEYRQLCTQF